MIMVKKENDSKTIEQGDIFFFYRPKIGIEEVEGIEDVQRFYMVTSSAEDIHGKKKEKYIQTFPSWTKATARNR